MFKFFSEIRNEVVIAFFILLVPMLNNVVFLNMSSYVQAEYPGDEIVQQNFILRYIKKYLNLVNPHKPFFVS
ncbi:MAG: hypothetical protein ABGF52_03105 [Candidatus Asgardarchaeum sp.]